MISAPPRERVLDAAAHLFADQGIRAVGVDTIIASAGVAKASFYRHFPSKTDLVATWLGSEQARWLDVVCAEVERRAVSPRERIVVFFDVLGEWLARDGPGGCPFLNTAAELHDAPAAVGDVVAGYLSEIQHYFRELARAAGLPSPNALGRQLQLLVAGSMSLALALHDPGTARTAADTARLMVGLATAPGKSPTRELEGEAA